MVLGLARVAVPWAVVGDLWVAVQELKLSQHN